MLIKTEKRAKVILEKAVKNPGQIAALEKVKKHTHSLTYGGSRSGKTTILTYSVFFRAFMKKSRSLITRFRFNHAKTSLWYDTFPKVQSLFFNGIVFEENKSDWFLKLEPYNSFGGESQIWLGGVDDKDRVEKILGNEYSTIYANECSQISYDAITTLRTRLAENSGLSLKFLYDMNPGSKRHWTYQEFIEGVVPGEKEKPKSEINKGCCLINPDDNIHNLGAAYQEILDSLPARQKKRFRDGLFQSDVEGALWTDEMVNQAKCKEPGKIKRTGVAIDPSTSNNKGSDECGIVVGSLDENNEAVIEADLSKKMSTNTWAMKAVNAFHDYEANFIVAEKNQGGDLVKNVIHAIDENIPVKLVHASKGKVARAELVTPFYERGKVSHCDFFPELETEMLEWVPEETNESPNRVDALVWLLKELMITESRKVRASVE